MTNVLMWRRLTRINNAPMWRVVAVATRETP